MEGIAYVLEMEKEAEKNYRSLAEKAINPGLRSVMILLAQEEARHHDYYRTLGERGEAQMRDSDLISTVREVFLKMKETGDISGIGASEVELYREALEVEKKHFEFYRKKADEVRDGAERQTLLKIAEEEKRHARVLENVVDFVSRPQEWLENAEWYHLEDY